MEGKWTQGEWRLAELHAHGLYDNEGSVRVLCGRGDDSVSIANVSARVQIKRGQGSRLVDPERDANAHLIAAAPALYAALKALVKAARAPVHLIDAGIALEQAADDAERALSQALGEPS